MDSTALHGSTLAPSLMFFLSIYLLACFVVFRNWDVKLRKDAPSSFMSLTHGIPAVFLAFQALLQSQTSPAFASPNSIKHNRVLEFSMAYFLMDLLHYLLLFPYGILFVLHHLATLYVLVTCRYVVRYGACEILVILILAEVTSPCQNIWSIAGLRRADNPTAARLYQVLSLPFLAFYSVVRGVVGPLFVVKMGILYLNREDNSALVPGWAWISWMVVIVIAILVSLLWVSNHWMHWLRETSRLAQKKVS